MRTMIYLGVSEWVCGDLIILIFFLKKVHRMISVELFLRIGDKKEGSVGGVCFLHETGRVGIVP